MHTHIHIYMHAYIYVYMYLTGLLHQTSSYHPVGQPSGFDGSARNLYVTSPVKILEPPGMIRNENKYMYICVCVCVCVFAPTFGIPILQSRFQSLLI